MTPRRRTITDAENVLDELIEQWRNAEAQYREQAAECLARAEALEEARAKIGTVGEDDEPDATFDPLPPREPELTS